MQHLKKWISDLELRATGKWFFLSTLIGIVAGLGAYVFHMAILIVAHYALGETAGFMPPETAGEKAIFPAPTKELQVWWILPVIVVGGAASGFLIYTYAPEAEGHGTDAAIDAYHNKRGFIRWQVPVIKTIASAITLGTGGSGGREGPIAQIGAGFGSFLGTKLKLSARDRRIMLAAGMGAGIGAIFRAPLAGAIFAGEILYSSADIEADVLVPSAIASIIAYSIFELLSPIELRFVPVFGTNLNYAITSPAELVPLTLLAVVLVIGAVAFIESFYGTHHLFKRLPISPYFRPMIGAGLTGLFAIGLYYAFDKDRNVLAVLSTGGGGLEQAIAKSATLSVWVLLAIGIGKLITTSLTIGSGGSGGVFGPSVIIGGCLGSAVGEGFNKLMPSLVPNPRMYGILGMAGFFAGAAHAPISTIIMVSEMTGDYQLLLPTMWVSTLCFLLCRRWKLYVKQVPRRLDSAAHRGDFIVDVLEGIHVRDVPASDRPLVRVPEGTKLRPILQMISDSRQHYFPVIDSAGRMIGIFSSDDLRSFMYDDAIWQLAVARDVMVSRIVSVTPETDLHTALKRFTELNLDELPIVDANDPGRLLGMLRRKDTIALYNARVMEHKAAALET